jgi:hypothetical protein
MLGPLSSHRAQCLLSPSARVLVAAAQPDAIEVGELPWDQVHWPTLVKMMTYERAEVPVCGLLRRSSVVVPEEVQRAVQALERVARFRAAELGAAAEATVDALSAAEVPVLWLKGAALAMQSPAGFGVRSMGDLDLLVAPADRERAQAALAGAGWVSRVAPGYETHHHDAPMTRWGGLRLELHSALFPPNHPFADESAADWLARGVKVEWGARRVLVLPPAWHVVHASVHWAWSHEGTVGSWQYLHDILRLTVGWAADGSEWAAVIRNAREIGAAMPTGWAVWCARQLAGLEVSEEVIEHLRGRRRLSRGMAERQWVLAAFHSPAASPSVRWSRYWWRKAMHGLGDAGGRWPWAIGRMASLVPVVAPPPMTHAVSRRLSRWRRHLVHTIWS